QEEKNCAEADRSYRVKHVLHHPKSVQHKQSHIGRFDCDCRCRTNPVGEQGKIMQKVNGSNRKLVSELPLLRYSRGMTQREGPRSDARLSHSHSIVPGGFDVTS